MGFGSVTVIGKDTLVPNEVPPGVVMDGLRASHQLFSGVRSTAINFAPGTCTSAATVSEVSATIAQDRSNDPGSGTATIASAPGQSFPSNSNNSSLTGIVEHDFFVCCKNVVR